MMEVALATEYRGYEFVVWKIDNGYILSVGDNYFAFKTLLEAKDFMDCYNL